MLKVSQAALTVLQVHLEAAQLRLHMESPGLAQNGRVRKQAGRLSFLAGEPEPDQEQNAKQHVVLLVALTLKSAQLPGPAQARRLDTAANQLETPLVRPHPAPCWQQEHYQCLHQCDFDQMRVLYFSWAAGYRFGSTCKRRGLALMKSLHRAFALCPPV